MKRWTSGGIQKAIVLSIKMCSYGELFSYITYPQAWVPNTYAWVVVGYQMGTKWEVVG